MIQSGVQTELVSDLFALVQAAGMQNESLGDRRLLDTPGAKNRAPAKS